MANSLSVHNPELWSRYLLKHFDAASVTVPLVNRQLEAEFSDEGDLGHRQKTGDVTISNYTPGTNISVQNLTSTDSTIDIDQKKAFGFFVDKVEQKQAKSGVNLVKEYNKRAMVAMAQTVDTFLLAKSSDVTSNATIGTAAAPITLTKDNIYEYFVKAYETLETANIPPGNYTALIDPAMKALMMQSPHLIRSTPLGDTIVQKATLGEFAGFKVVVTNRYATSSGVKDIMFADFEMLIDLVFQIPPDHFEPLDQPLQFGMGTKGLALYGAKVFHPEAGVVLKRAV